MLRRLEFAKRMDFLLSSSSKTLADYFFSENVVVLVFGYHLPPFLFTSVERLR